MIAEGELRFNNDVAAAKAALDQGIANSLDKVESFESLVATKMSTTVTLRDGSSGTIKGLYGMSASDKTNYLAEIDAMWNAAGANQLDIVIKEFYIAAWGNGLEAYNMYRRTGYPAGIMPALEVDPGAFPLSFFYPAISVDRNASINQKADLTTPVFWQDAHGL